MLEIKKNSEGKVCTFSLIGRLDTTTAPEFDAKIRETIGECDEIVIDFTNLAYISSAGLRVILSAHKAMMKKGGLSLINVSDDVMEIFEVTGFTDILNIK